MKSLQLHDETEKQMSKILSISNKNLETSLAYF